MIDSLQPEQLFGQMQSLGKAMCSTLESLRGSASVP